MVLREIGRNLAISVMGIVAASASEISSELLTDPLRYLESEPRWHYYTGPFWAALTLSVPFAIGYFATRRVWLQTALAYCVFSVIVNVWTQSHLSGYSYEASFLKGLDRISAKFTLIGILVSCSLAQIGVWTRRRRTKQALMLDETREP
jgi:hypothetical protein